MPSALTPLGRAILEALAYSDIFEHPLRIDELRRYLPEHANVDELSVALTSLMGHLGKREDYFFLADRDRIVQIRKQREARSRKLLPTALRYGKILGALPFVRMVALTGSLAVLNVSKNADFDYMLVTAKDRVWTARLFAMALNRLARLLGHTLCPNLIVSETALEWPLHDLYSARELCQMIPITGMEMYRQLMEVNEWAGSFLPNVSMESGGLPLKIKKQTSTLKSLLELPFHGKLGDRFEKWEMDRKIAKFSKQPGFGEETFFTAEVCQGNFHHHRKWTKEAFEEKLIAIESPLPVGEG